MTFCVKCVVTSSTSPIILLSLVSKKMMILALPTRAVPCSWHISACILASILVVISSIHPLGGCIDTSNLKRILEKLDPFSFPSDPPLRLPERLPKTHLLPHQTWLGKIRYGSMSMCLSSSSSSSSSSSVTLERQKIPQHFSASHKTPPPARGGNANAYPTTSFRSFFWRSLCARRVTCECKNQLHNNVTFRASQPQANHKPTTLLKDTPS
mmetsp:Transcript_29611/g.68459  ORF Transcript_29611/g.68459 Transcript_29611/m.68459 type:complete len:211 (-) Transcript_29611:17-649(-)